MKHTGKMLTIASAPSSTPQYSADLFVNRKEEIELVLHKAANMVMGMGVRVRTIVFWGHRGTGKTWLLKEITKQLEKMTGVKPVYVDLSMYADQSANEAVKALLFRISETLGTTNPIQASLFRHAGDVPPDVIVAWLASDIQTLLQQQVLVILLDHVYESDWRLLADLEDRFLAPLVVDPRVLLVMAGRGRPYPWKTPELRLYITEDDLKPFDQDLTGEQLRKQRPEAAFRTPEIHEMSQGYPLGNYLLATRPTVVEAMQEAVDGLLEGVATEERSWLEALCVLRAFDEDRIPVLLATYWDDRSRVERLYSEVRQTRNRLLQTTLVHWKEEAGGWVVDEAVRPVLEKYLQQTKPEIWRRLHCAAYRLYRDWQQQYPSEKQRWQNEAEYHAKRLRDAGHDPDQCL